jgi:hypothetical protein
MICYICHKQTKKALVVDKVNYGYCEEHETEVQLGVVKLMLTNKADFLNTKKEMYLNSKRSAAEIELEKQLNIEEFLSD